MTTTQETNGTMPAMAQVTDVLRAAAAEAVAKRDLLAQELAIARREATNYERALILIETAGDPPSEPEPGKRGPRGSYTKAKNFSPASIARYTAAIEKYAAELGPETEFRQIDIRRLTGQDETTGVSSGVFGELRRRGMLRIARKEGQNTYYRMTQSALADSAAAGDE
jgi:hypothetical protein